MAAPGGRQDDWPAQHDQIILFVPGLTPQFLRDNRITPVDVDPYRGAQNFTLVGVGSTGGVTRDFMAQKYVNATPSTITQSPRDGYLSTDHTTANHANSNPGDSGGPSIGSFFYNWIDNSQVEYQKYMVGTVQNGDAMGWAAAGPRDLAPLAYDPGITMTANQRLTVRLNSLWVQARMDERGQPERGVLPRTAVQPLQADRRALHPDRVAHRRVLDPLRGVRWSVPEPSPTLSHP
jgi:hypothetical protein